jgi:hypothetical protein
MSLSFKIFLGNEIRRFSLTTDNLTYEKFTEKLSQNIPSYHLEMKTLYEDSDKDKVIFSCEIEFQEMLSHLKQIQNGELTLVKIWIEDSTIPYFRDGTQEVIKLYSTGKDALIEHLENTKPIQERITSALSRLFPNNTILPYHIPSFLKEVISVKTMGTADAEVDVTVDGLAAAINTEALRLMDSAEENDLTKTKLLLESLQILKPDDPFVYYNLACTESLLKNVQSSLEQLQTAFKYGYNNFQHMMEDKDLAFLRLHQQYNDFVKAVVGDSEVSEPVETEQPVKIEESKIEEPKIEEPKIEESKKIIEPEKEEAKPERWGDEIQVLKGMGFQLQESVFIDILDHHKGNLEAAVQGLI